MILLGNNKALKINGIGSTGFNMFAVAQVPDGFRPEFGYGIYLVGSQLFYDCQSGIGFSRQASLYLTPTLTQWGVIVCTLLLLAVGIATLVRSRALRAKSNL